MTDIVLSKNCDNSPKDALVLDLYKQLFDFNVEKSADLVTKDIVFSIHGHGDYTGTDGLKRMIDDMKTSGAKTLCITNILHHDRFVATQGEITMDDDTKMAFAEIYEFTDNEENAKITRVDSYVVPASDAK
jgi:hypothetical protein